MFRTKSKIVWECWRMFKIEKYQNPILGPSSSDSVVNLEKKFGKTFSWVCMIFLGKASQKSGILIKTR